MSLAFLSKKTWHVTNFSNQEAVWKAEQAKAEEQRKLEEWKKKREEERQIMELKQLQRESGQGGGEGAVKQQERVEFLYDMPATKKEEYLLGKPIEIEPEESDVKKVAHLPGSNFLPVGQNNLSSSRNEEFNKMNNDPLMAMRLAEQQALQRILNNPIKMKEVQSRVEERKRALMEQSSGSGSGDRHKSHKRDKHHHKSSHRSSGSDKHHRSSKHDKHDRHDQRDDKHDRHDQRDDKHDRHDQRDDRHDDRRDRREKHHSSKHRKRSRRHSSDSSSGSDSEDVRPREEAQRETSSAAAAAANPLAQRKAGYGLQIYSGGVKVSDASLSSAAPSGGACDFEPSASFAGARPGMVFMNGPKGVGYYRDPSSSAGSAQPPPAASAASSCYSASHSARPATCSSSASGRYGSSSGGGGAARHHHRRRGGALSAAEKEERLRQMMSDAERHDIERHKRAKIADAHAADEAAALHAEAMKASADGVDGRGPSFVRDMAKRVGNESSVAEQINQQKHYLQRNKSGDAASFTSR